MPEYQPGVCNIGPTERQRRFRIGLVSGVAAVAVTAWVVLTDQPPLYYVGTYVLLFGAFLGYLQARMEFCVGFAALAQYDVGDDAGEVSDADLRRKDWRRAAELTVYSIALAAAVTLLVVVADGVFAP